jgi:hypothetical protein
VSRLLCHVLATVLLLGPPAAPAQQPQPEGPQIRVNIIQVCTPPEADAREMAAALARIPRQARFAADFEVARGRSSRPEPASRWVRIRREFVPGAPVSTVQYSFSVDEEQMVQTLVFHLRDSRDVLQVVIESALAAGAGEPATLLAEDRPADHIKIERFGRPSTALRACPAADQSAYAGIFDEATAALARYSALLGVRATVPPELGRAAAPPRAQRPPAAAGVKKQ